MDEIIYGIFIVWFSIFRVCVCVCVCVCGGGGGGGGGTDQDFQINVFL